MRSPALLAGRVRLREISGGDSAAIRVWYDEAARAAYEERSFDELRRSTGTVLAIARPDADEPIGLVEYVVKDGWSAVRFIALARAYRGWGFGSEAMRLVEEWAVGEGIGSRFRAEVDVRNGLGLYFWLRLGYRPATTDELDWQRDERRDKMPMVRVAAQPSGSAGEG